ncbi:hypothetical protein ES703_102641 [subsurface metagenome]
MWGGLPECEHEWIESKSGLVHENRNFSIGSQEDVHGEKETTWIRKYDSQKAGFCSKCGAWRGSLGLEPHPQLFIDHLVEICRNIRRVLKPSGTFWCNLGDTYCTGKGKSKSPGGDIKRGIEKIQPPSAPNRTVKLDGGWLQPKQLLMIPARVAIALQHDGWILRNDICWFKPNHMPSSVKDRLTCAYEHIFLFAKARRYYFDLDAIRKPFSEGTFLRIRQPNIDNQPGGPKTMALRGGKPQSGNASRPIDMAQELARKIASGERVGKNPGDLWRIPTTPFPGAHFSTFPPKLIEPIVKAGCPRWICSRCGKPRTRITTNPIYEKFKIENWTKMEDEKIDKYDSKFSERQGVHSQSRSLGAYRNWLRENGLGEFESGAPTETVGWSDCGCGEKWIPGIVMDPFCGSGTALRVARRLGRRFIGIDIMPEYLGMAEQRIRGRYKPLPEGAVTLDQFMEAEK